MKIAIFGNEYQSGHVQAIAELAHAIVDSGMELAFEQVFYNSLQGLDIPACHTFDCHRLPACDVALSLGGDGTFLTTVMWMAPLQVPIMGINTGHLGYLTAYRLDEARHAVQALQRGDYRIEERTMLTVTCDGADIGHPYALNDVAILRHDSSAMLEMETALNGDYLTTYKGDGLVVSTPTGSTAYNLSAGGPIMAPDTRCLVLSPLSPHSLTMRPLVVNDNDVIHIHVHSRASHFQVSIDGETIVCPINAHVTIERAAFNARVVLDKEHSFAATLRQKLFWGTH